MNKTKNKIGKAKIVLLALFSLLLVLSISVAGWGMGDDLELRVYNLENTVNGNKWVASLPNRIDRLETQVADLELHRANNDYETQISTLQLQINTLESKVSALESQIKSRKKINRK